MSNGCYCCCPQLPLPTMRHRTRRPRGGGCGRRRDARRDVCGGGQHALRHPLNEVVEEAVEGVQLEEPRGVALLVPAVEASARCMSSAIRRARPTRAVSCAGARRRRVAPAPPGPRRAPAPPRPPPPQATAAPPLASSRACSCRSVARSSAFSERCRCMIFPPPPHPPIKPNAAGTTTVPIPQPLSIHAQTTQEPRSPLLPQDSCPYVSNLSSPLRFLNFIISIANRLWPPALPSDKNNAEQEERRGDAEEENRRKEDRNRGSTGHERRKEEVGCRVRRRHTRQRQREVGDTCRLPRGWPESHAVNMQQATETAHREDGHPPCSTVRQKRRSSTNGTTQAALDAPDTRWHAANVQVIRITGQKKNRFAG
jgi:hypothetical protein